MRGHLSLIIRKKLTHHSVKWGPDSFEPLESFMCHLIYISSHSTQPIRSPHLVRYQFVASKWVIISPDAIAAKNLSETNLLSVAGRRPFYVGRASCWRGWGKNFLFSFLKRREKMEGEAARITQAGRTGRWETNVPLISRWWTRSGRAPPPLPPSPCENPGRLRTNVLLTSSGQPVIGKPSVAGRGMRSGREMRHQRQRVKVSISQSCL